MKLCECFRVVLSREVHMKAVLLIFFRPEKCAVKFSLDWRGDVGGTRIEVGVESELDGGSCLYISIQLVREISL